MNLTTYLLDPMTFNVATEALAVDKRVHVARDLTDLELHHWGFTDDTAWSDGERWHLDVIHTERVLSPKVVQLKTEERVRELERDGEAVDAKRYKAVREATLSTLIQNAPQLRTTLPVCLHQTLGLVLIGTAKARDAEAVLTLLRKELGSFPALPMETCSLGASVPARLTDALAEGQPAPPFTLGNRATLQLPGDKAKARFTDMDLYGEEVQECLRRGMRAVRVELWNEDRVSFELDANLVLRRFDTDVSADEDRWDEELDRWGERATRVIVFGEAVRVLLAVARWMGVEQPLAREQKAA